MASLFSSPKVPKATPQQVVEAPKVEDPAVQKAAADSLLRRKLAAGFRSTVLNNQMGGGKLKETLGS